MSYIDEAVKSTIRWEATIPWMYLDSRGNVTVGIGELVENAGQACLMPFQTATGNATDDEIVADFNRVAVMSPDKSAGYYHCDTSPTLSQVTMTGLLTTRIEHNDGVLRAAFEDYDSFPDDAKIALLDMEFNLGQGELLRGYPKMDAAVKLQNWVEVAEQSARLGIQPIRNSWTANMFLQAAQLGDLA